MGACLAGEKFQIDMPYIHVQESYVDLSNEGNYYHYYEIAQDDVYEDIYQEQKGNTLNFTYTIKDQQMYKICDRIIATENVLSADESGYKNCAKLKEKGYFQTEDTEKQLRFIDRDQTELDDRESSEVFGYIALPYSTPNQVKCLQETSNEIAKKGLHSLKTAKRNCETKHIRARPKLRSINKADYQCPREIPLYIKPSESSRIELNSMQGTQHTPAYFSEYVHMPTSNDVLNVFKDCNNGVIIPKSPQNVFSDYMENKGHLDKLVTQQIQQYEGNTGFILRGDECAIEFENGWIHLCGFIKMKQDRRLIEIKIKNQVTCINCGSLMPPFLKLQSYVDKK